MIDLDKIPEHVRIRETLESVTGFKNAISPEYNAELIDELIILERELLKEYRDLTGTVLVRREW